MASTPKKWNTSFFFAFSKRTLGLKEMGKFLWEGREKSLPSWLSQFSFTKLRQPTGQTLGLDAMPLSFKNLLLR